MVHSYYYYPQKGGIQTLINLMSTNIPKQHIGKPIKSIKSINNKVLVNENTYDYVINTIPLPELVTKFTEMDPKITNCINELKYNSVKSYLFTTEKENTYSWMYIPDEKIIPHRIVYQGNLSDEAAPHRKSSITVEITKPEIYSENEILENIKTYLGLENPIAENYTKYAYVVFDKNRKSNINQIKEYMKNYNIILHGRFAEWEYPNMDICIKNSIDLANKLDQYKNTFF